VGERSHQPQNSEKYRDVLKFSSKTPKFCPKSANFEGGQGFNREFRELPPSLPEGTT
jgi:hypothetical protein